MRAARLGLRGRAAGWWVLLAVVIGVVAANSALADRSRGSASHEASTGAAGLSAASGPSMVRARSVATQEFGLLSGGGWAQAWGLWSAAGRAALSQADFVLLNTQCRPALGEPYVINTATDVTTTTVRLTWHQGSTAGNSTVVYEGGAWRFQPDAETLAGYRGGVAALVAERKAAGECH